jgi:predicted NAD/FAD-binding protein
MASAWLLQDDHQVTLMDRAPRLGGHVETIPVAISGHTVHAELGPRFFFETAYPYFLGLLRLLAVPIRWHDARVSFTNVALGHTAVLPPRSLRHVAALLRSPRLVRHMLSLRRLIAEQPAVVARRDFSIGLRRHLANRRYPERFGPEFLYPFLAACWGAPLHELPEFPVYSLLKGMPSGKKPGFYEIPGGMSRYVRAFGDKLTRVEIRLDADVRRIHHAGDFQVEDASGARQHFDRLIVATSARDAAELLRGVPEAAALQAAVVTFRHFHTEIAVHGDASFMPPRRADWSHNNLFLEGEAAWMTDWQGLDAGLRVFRTWLPAGRALPQPLYARRSFHHLVMSPQNAGLQRQIAALQGSHGLWVTGMYAVDVDNHESALLYALVPACALAPRSQNLARLLGAVAPDAAHGLEVLPLPAAPQAREAGSLGSGLEQYSQGRPPKSSTEASPFGAAPSKTTPSGLL